MRAARSFCSASASRPPSMSRPRPRNINSATEPNNKPSGDWNSVITAAVRQV
jgi:hypothetical protein